MLKEFKKDIIINNYFHIISENQRPLVNLDLNKLLNISYSSLFHPIKKDYVIKSFLTHKRSGPENKIIINEEIEKKALNDENILINFNNKNSTKKIEEELKKEETKDITIEIPSKEFGIFKVEQTNIKKISGRKPKNFLLKGKHTKYSNDNILRKIKVKFFKKLIKYINNVKENSEFKDKINEIKPLNSDICQNNTIKFNQNLLKLKLKDVFSSHAINGKFKFVEKDYNREIINKIYELNIKELINIFEMTFIEAFSIFRDLKETEKLNGMEKIDSVINEMKKKGEKEEYLNKFLNIAERFENFYFKKLKSYE